MTRPEKLKRFLIMFLLGVLCFLGHYSFYSMEIPCYKVLRAVSGTSTTTLCLFGSVFLMLNSEGSRSRKMFAFIMGMFALAGMATISWFIATGYQKLPRNETLSPVVMLYGNVYIFICLLYPLELLHPGKTCLRRYFMLLLPVLVMGLFYGAALCLKGDTVVQITSWTDMIDNIGRFDLWFRFTIFIYPAWITAKVLQYKKQYQRWREENYANADSNDLDWISYYLFGFFILLCSYVFVILGHNPQSMIMHNICFLGFFAFAFLKITASKLPSPADRPSLRESGPLTCSTPCSVSDPEEYTIEKHRFGDKIPEYKLILEQWMHTEKPYLDKDFKLLDVMQVLPLNRSYLSRMFNEVYGETFFSFVTRYRIEESIRLLTSRSDLTMARIAQICGFSSASVFGRTFLRNVGMTPNNYRNSQMNKTGACPRTNA